MGSKIIVSPLDNRAVAYDFTPYDGELRPVPFAYAPSGARASFRIAR